MKSLFIFLTIIASQSAFAEETLFQGKLFKHNGTWNLFVESENTSFKKGVLELIKVPKAYQETLIDKSFVAITGHIEKCDSRTKCLAVKTMTLSTYDPLKK